MVPFSMSIVFVAASSLVLSDEDGEFIVHEWGTFTSFTASDGVQLDFRPLVENDLPGFVYDRARQAGSADRAAADGQKAAISAPQRMETPVTYFYSSRERDIAVRVELRQGLLTEFYPPVTAQTPAWREGGPEPCEGSTLEWKSIRLLPGGGLSFPVCEPNTHYGFARGTDAVPLRVTGPHGEHAEKFLFYRGVGRFALPLTVQVGGQDQFTIETQFASPIAAAFLFQLENGGVRISSLEPITGKRSATLSKQPSSPEAIRVAMRAALLDAGLFPKEADAMLRTWESSWFSEEGTRLLYLLPASEIDRILPITIRPVPDAIVRVMVGRLEILTPERQEKLEHTLRRFNGSRITQAMAASVLNDMGRFAEPILQRLQATSRDAEVRSAAEALLNRPGL